MRVRTADERAVQTEVRVSVRRPRVVVLDDDAEFAELMEALLEEEGFVPLRAAADADLAAVLTARPIDVAIIGLGPTRGLDIVRHVRSQPALRTLPILVCSGDIQEMRDHAAALAEMDNVAGLEKPFRVDALIGALERLLAGSIHPPSVGVAPDSDASAALEAQLASLGTSLRWPVLDVWVPDIRPGMLRCAASWAASRRLAAFAQLSRRTLLPFGGGVPGRVWVSGRSAWVEDLAADLNFPRQVTARRSGLVSAAAVPVREGGEIVGVVAGYDQRLRTRDDVELARLVDAVADAGPMIRAAAGLAR